ncbi:MAG: phosphatase PAP2 family protein [Alphaproteobacteria bacterium]|nr:phosphatase PAP2 family protein [Alphaproteobacteria bacterium]
MVARADAADASGLGRGLGRGAALIFVAASAICAMPFLLHPEIDLVVARWLWDAQGGRFQPPTGWFWPIYVGLRPLVYATAAGVAAVGVLNALRGTRLLGLDCRAAIYVLLALGLGPGLVAEIGFKDHWGRARPREIVEFGGTQRFTPAFQPADQCATNCSFVSGHAALAFGFAPLAFLLHGTRRRAALAAVTAAALGIGAMRMVQGAHFLSDVIFAGFVVVGIAWALAALILKPEPRTGAR